MPVYNDGPKKQTSIPRQPTPLLSMLRSLFTGTWRAPEGGAKKHKRFRSLERIYSHGHTCIWRHLHTPMVRHWSSIKGGKNTDLTSVCAPRRKGRTSIHMAATGPLEEYMYEKIATFAYDLTKA
ncbi:hypothetical protein CDAR_40201 [Caerostris darwini]|uniref:Uncharacterized protein n=1 Tax=Caerostris darwini TaxID=1538125 RepID=A0AAV4RDP1_9ARAC|nr:hypothetical protein CDAR_40201 [Caerostris darwini]